MKRSVYMTVHQVFIYGPCSSGCFPSTSDSHVRGCRGVVICVEVLRHLQWDQQCGSTPEPLRRLRRWTSARRRGTCRSSAPTWTPRACAPWQPAPTCTRRCPRSGAPWSSLAQQGIDGIQYFVPAGKVWSTAATLQRLAHHASCGRESSGDRPPGAPRSMCELCMRVTAGCLLSCLQGASFLLAGC